MNKVELRGHHLAYAARTALSESTGQLPPDVRDRLTTARRMAFAQKKAEASSMVHSLALAMPGGGSVFFEMEDETPSPLQRAATVLRRLGLLWPTITLVVGLAGIYQWQQQQCVDELAEVDVAMLLDDLPLAAHAD